MRWLTNTLTLALLVFWVGLAESQTGRITAAPIVPVAETKLLMEGINLPNFQGLEKRLAQPPADLETWKIIRGQALLIAENGNLLLLRPPRTEGQDAWNRHGADLRDTATNLARLAGTRDYERAKIGLQALADACNRCHQSFRIGTRITPFAEPKNVQLPP